MSELRVPISTPRFSPVRFVRNVATFVVGAMHERGDTTAMTFSPLAVRESRAAWVFGPVGLRLEGHRWPLALAWTELARVGLEVQSAPVLGLQSLRVVLWPTDGVGFAARHPRARALWDPTRGTWAAVLGKGPEIPEATVQAAVAGLAHAGSRFDGQVARVRI